MDKVHIYFFSIHIIPNKQKTSYIFYILIPKEYIPYFYTTIIVISRVWGTITPISTLATSDCMNENRVQQKEITKKYLQCKCSTKI